jgi:hypothetical protein
MPIDVGAGAAAGASVDGGGTAGTDSAVDLGAAAVVTGMTILTA